MLLLIEHYRRCFHVVKTSLKNSYSPSPLKWLWVSEIQTRKQVQTWKVQTRKDRSVPSYLKTCIFATSTCHTTFAFPHNRENLKNDHNWNLSGHNRKLWLRRTLVRGKILNQTWHAFITLISWLPFISSFFLATWKACQAGVPAQRYRNPWENLTNKLVLQLALGVTISLLKRVITAELNTRTGKTWEVKRYTLLILVSYHAAC